MSKALILSPGCETWSEEDMYKMVKYIQFERTEDPNYAVDKNDFAFNFIELIDKIKENGILSGPILIYNSPLSSKPSWEILSQNKKFAVWNNNEFK